MPANLKALLTAALLSGVTLAMSGCTNLGNSLGLTGNIATDTASVAGNITNASTQAQQTVSSLSKIVSADLQAALADATAHNDTAAVDCYQALLPVVQARESVTAGAGAISAFQNARDVVKLIDGSGSLGIACAALNASVKSDVLNIGALFGLP